MSISFEKFLLDINSHIKINKSEIYGIYEFGSRVYGTATSTSDFDIIVVVSHCVFIRNKILDKQNLTAKEYLIALHEGKYSVHFIESEFFKISCFKHDAVMLLFISLPKKHVWFETEEMCHYRKNFIIDLMRLKAGSVAESSISFAKAKRCWIENDIYKSKKNVIHGIRYLMFGVQMAKHGRIIDYSEANILVEKV